VLAPAILLRLDAELGYRWQAWFNDSFEYVQNTVKFQLDPTRVSGYSIWLKILQPLHTYAVVTILQHLMGLAVAVMVYALARRRFRAPAWLATLAAVPVLYDGFEIQLEHLIMADAPFLFLLMLATTLLLWDPVPSWRRCLLIGALLGVAEIVRSVGLPLLAVFAVYMIIRRISWRKVAAAIVVCFLPVVAYAGWFDLEHGQFGMSDATGVFLYSRVMTFADCAKMHIPLTPPDNSELSLCSTVPPAQRPIAQAYIWTSPSPLDRFPPSKFSQVPNQLAEKFAIRAIEAQPLDYAKAVFRDTWRVFGWHRAVFPNAATYDEYIFGYRSLSIPTWDQADLGPYHSYASAYVHGNPLTQVVAPFANVMRLYEHHVYLPGTVYGLILLAGLGGLVLAWRRVGGEALLPWTLSLALVVIPAATAEFDYRYVLVAVPFACLAAAMAFSPGTAGGALARRMTERTTQRLAGRRQQRQRTGIPRAAEVPSPVADKATASAGRAGHDKRDLSSDGA
jgi:4-amino-4-deoxy-L-arabinose transferase-like glycosyltransferase